MRPTAICSHSSSPTPATGGPTPALGGRTRIIARIIDAIRAISAGAGHRHPRVSVEGGRGGRPHASTDSAICSRTSPSIVDYLNLTVGVRTTYVKDMGTEEPPILELDRASAPADRSAHCSFSQAFRRGRQIELALASGADLVGMARPVDRRSRLPGASSCPVARAASGPAFHATRTAAPSTRAAVLGQPRAGPAGPRRAGPRLTAPRPALAPTRAGAVASHRSRTRGPRMRDLAGRPIELVLFDERERSVGTSRSPRPRRTAVEAIVDRLLRDRSRYRFGRHRRSALDPRDRRRTRRLRRGRDRLPAAKRSYRPLPGIDRAASRPSTRSQSGPACIARDRVCLDRRRRLRLAGRARARSSSASAPEPLGSRSRRRGPRSVPGPCPPRAARCSYSRACEAPRSRFGR